MSSEWAGYVLDHFVFTDYAPGTCVVDVGFGAGGNLRRLEGAGCKAIGVEYDPTLAAHGRMKGLRVLRAKAEQLPFRTASLDGLICKVVIPYTEEAQAIAEMARVLKPGAVAHLEFHGLGYSLKYLCAGENWKFRVYGGRVIVNTVYYRLTGARLPGFIGDTLYQSRARLERYYRREGLELLADPPARGYLGAPVFIYHTVRRVAA